MQENAEELKRAETQLLRAIHSAQTTKRIRESFDSGRATRTSSANPNQWDHHIKSVMGSRSTDQSHDSSLGPRQSTSNHSIEVRERSPSEEERRETIDQILSVLEDLCPVGDDLLDGTEEPRSVRSATHKHTPAHALMPTLGENSSLSELGQRARQLQLHHCADLLFAAESRIINLVAAARSLQPEQELPPGRAEILAPNFLGTCEFDVTGNGEYETFDLVGGISDVGTQWGYYQRFTELGKHMSCHHSMTKFMDVNDWGISAKPPDIYATRFEESICVYLGVPCYEDDFIRRHNASKRCCQLCSRTIPDTYYPDHESDPESDSRGRSTLTSDASNASTDIRLSQPRAVHRESVGSQHSHYSRPSDSIDIVEANTGQNGTQEIASSAATISSGATMTPNVEAVSMKEVVPGMGDDYANLVRMV